MSKTNKTRDITTYNKEYMRCRYKSNPVKCRLERNTNRLKHVNEFNSEIISTYTYYLSNVVKITKLFNQLPSELKTELLENIENYNFDNVNLKV